MIGMGRTYTGTMNGTGTTFVVDTFRSGRDIGSPFAVNSVDALESTRGAFGVAMLLGTVDVATLVGSSVTSNAFGSGGGAASGDGAAAATSRC